MLLVNAQKLVALDEMIDERIDDIKKECIQDKEKSTLYCIEWKRFCSFLSQRLCTFIARFQNFFSEKNVLGFDLFVLS